MTTDTPERLMMVNVNEELAHFLRDGSRSDDPEFVLITGTGVCGKTRIRHAQFAQRYVNVDAGDIFRRIEGERILDFPGEHRWAIDVVGSLVAEHAIRERRNLARGPHNISAYCTDEFNVKWLMEAAAGVGARRTSLQPDL